MEAVTNLAQQAGITYSFAPEVLSTNGTPAGVLTQAVGSVRFENVTARQALDALLTQKGLVLGTRRGGTEALLGTRDSNLVPLEVEGGDLARMGAGNEPAPKQEGEPAQAPLPIELSFLPGDDGDPGSVLQATLIGPTSDYDLVLVRVKVDEADVDADGGGKADVYLYRKVPGVGEGMLDIVEEHTVTADVSGAKTVRVFLATGTKSEPGLALAWRLLPTLAP